MFVCIVVMAGNIQFRYLSRCMSSSLEVLQSLRIIGCRLPVVHSTCTTIYRPIDQPAICHPFPSFQPFPPTLTFWIFPFHFVAISILRFIFLFQCTVLYRRSSSVESMKSCESTINKFCLSPSVPSCMFLVFSRSAWHTIISQSIHVHGITNMLLYAHYYVWIHQLNEKLCTRWHLIWWNCKQRLRWIDVAKSS